MTHPYFACAVAALLVFGHAQQADAGARVKVSADKMRMVNTAQGEAAKAEGHVTIEIPGEVRIQAPVAQLLKGPDGKLSRAVFPGSVKIVDLRPEREGTWNSEHNAGGYYDFETGAFTELNPKGTYEFEPRPTGGARP